MDERVCKDPTRIQTKKRMSLFLQTHADSRETGQDSFKRLVAGRAARCCHKAVVKCCLCWVLRVVHSGSRSPDGCSE